MEDNYEATNIPADFTREEKLRFGQKLVEYYEGLDQTQIPDDEMGIKFEKSDGAN